MDDLYAEITQPEDIPIREREDAMGAYLMMFGALAAGLPLPIINLIAAVIYYYLNRNKSRFVKFHTLQSLYSQFPTTLMNAGLIFWTVRMFVFAPDNSALDSASPFSENNAYWAYLWMVVLANLLYIIFSIIGAVRARKGHMYYFVFFGKLAYHRAFLRRPEDEMNHKNLPPA